MTYLSQSYFPFVVPEKDARFASSVGPQTIYPAGFSLEKALQIYWRAKGYRLIAAGGGRFGTLTQSLAVNEILPSRNAVVGTNTYFEVDGLNPLGPGDLVTGIGLTQLRPGSGTVTTTGGDSNPEAEFNLLINLFFPALFVPDPVVKYAGKWWPAMSVSSSTDNTVTVHTGGELSMVYSCDSFDPASTVEIGSFSFFGESVPVFCGPLGSGETRSFSGSIAVEMEWD